MSPKRPKWLHLPPSQSLLDPGRPNGGGVAGILSDAASAFRSARAYRFDRTIQDLIAERARWAHKVGRAKGPLKAAVDYYRPEREAQVLRRVVDRNEGPLHDETLVRLFREICPHALHSKSHCVLVFSVPRERSRNKRYTSILATCGSDAAFQHRRSVS